MVDADACDSGVANGHSRADYHPSSYEHRAHTTPGRQGIASSRFGVDAEPFALCIIARPEQGLADTFFGEFRPISADVTDEHKI